MLKTQYVEVQNISELHSKITNIVEYKRIDKQKRTKKATLSDYQSFFSEFALLLQSNISLIDAIYLLDKNIYKDSIRNLIDSFKISFENGTSIYSQLKTNKDYPSEVYFFIKNCESTGEYHLNIQALAHIFEYKIKIKDKLFKLLSYPLFLILSLVVSFIFMVFFILPEFEYIFIQFNNKLPLATDILLSFKYFLEEYYVYLFGFLVAFYCIVLYLQHNNKILFDKFLYKHIPFFSTLYRNYLHYQLFLIISISLETNNKITDTFKYIQESFSNSYFNSIASEILKDINNGKLFHDAFKKQSVFDQYILRLLLVADNTNEYGKTFKTLTDVTLYKIEKRINLIAKILSPLLLLIIGAFLLMMILGIMSPVWEFSKIG